MKHLAYASALLVALAATPSLAAEQRFEFDKAHTQIVFSVSHLGYSHSFGKFTDFDGHFTFDPANPKAGGNVSVIINTNSVDMSNAVWSEHMRGENMLNTAKFPEMTFKSTRVDVKEDDEADLYGDLTLLGVTKPVKLEVELNKCGPNPMSGTETCGFSAEGTIKREDWGMTYGLPALGNDIDIRIEVEGSPTN